MTNGWAWIGTLLIPIVGLNWFTISAASWLAFLWMPWTPEKIIIIPVAYWIYKHMFVKYDPVVEDEYKKLKEQAHEDWITIKNKFKRSK